MNIIDQSGVLAISTRLQRLSEQLRKDGIMLYKSFGIEFEPKWFPVVYTLHKKGVLSVLEIAGEIGYTHPSTISLLKELEKHKLVRSKKDKADERKRLLSLTKKAEELVESMMPVWNIMTTALNEITDNQNNIMKAIDEAEKKIAEQSFYQRAIALRNARLDTDTFEL